MTGASPAVLYDLADALEHLERAHEALRADPGDVSASAVRAIGAIERDLCIALAMVEPSLDTIATAVAEILGD